MIPVRSSISTFTFTFIKSAGFANYARSGVLAGGERAVALGSRGAPCAPPPSSLFLSVSPFRDPCHPRRTSLHVARLTMVSSENSAEARHIIDIQSRATTSSALPQFRNRLRGSETARGSFQRNGERDEKSKKRRRRGEGGGIG